MPTRQTVISKDTEQIDLTEILFRSVEPGVLVVDSSQNLAALNSTAQRLLASNGAGGAGQSIDSLPEAIRAPLKETFAERKPIVDRSVVYERPGQDRLVLRANTYFLPDHDGTSPSVMLALHDVSAARELEVKTERLQRLASLGILSAGVAHEIKNALVAIKSFAELLQEKNQDVEMVSLVVQEANRINALVGQLLRLAGPAKSSLSKASVHESIHNALRLVKHQLKNRTIQLNVDLRADSDLIQGESKQLEQALINLMLNAIEAMGETGALKISTDTAIADDPVSKFEPLSSSPSLIIQVQDTGAGIPDHLQRSLFEPFFTTKPGGTGLGLAITRRIVLALGGHIEVSSVTGEGTTFRIALPLARAANTPDRAPNSGQV